MQIERMFDQKTYTKIKRPFTAGIEGWVVGASGDTGEGFDSLSLSSVVYPSFGK